VQLGALRDSWKSLQDAGAVVYGVNPASDSSHKRFVEKLCLPFPLIVDAGGRVARAFKSGWGRLVRRTVYVLAPDGRVAYSRRGMPPVRDLLDSIERLGAPTPD